MSKVAIGNVEFDLIQWNRIGDHPIVKENISPEFACEELAREGCGFINTFQVVHPGDFLLEINGHILAVLSPAKVSEVFNVEIA